MKPLSIRILCAIIVIFLITGGYQPIQKIDAATSPKLTSAYLAGSQSDSFAIALEFEKSSLQQLDYLYAYTQFQVNVDGRYRNVNSALGSDSIVILTVEGSVGSNSRVHVSYFPGAFPLIDKQGNKVEEFREYYISMGADHTRPEIQSVRADGKSILLTFNKSMDTSAELNTYQFVVEADHVYQEIAGLYLTPNTLMILLDRAIGESQNITLSYLGGETPLLDHSGNSVDMFHALPVPNQSQSVSITSAIATDEVITLTFAEILVGKNPPVGAITVQRNGKFAAITDIQIIGPTVELHLYDKIANGESVVVSYDNRVANALETNSGAAVKSFTDYKVKNAFSGENDNMNEQTPGSSNDHSGSSGENASEETNPGGGNSGIVAASSVSIDPSLAAKSVGVSPAGVRGGYYTIPEENLETAFRTAIGSGNSKPDVTFTVPSTESTAIVAFPIATLLGIRQASTDATITIVFSDTKFRLDLGSLDDEWLIEQMLANHGQGYLKLEIDGPTRGMSPTLALAVDDSGANLVVEPINVSLSFTAGTVSVPFPAQSYVMYGEILTDKKVDAASSAVVRYDSGTNQVAYIPNSIKKSAGKTKITLQINSNESVAVSSRKYSYSDTAQHWAAAEIAQLSNKYIIAGHTPNTFNPQVSVTRGEFASYIARGLGLNGNHQAAKLFKDLKKHPDAAYIGAAAEAGIVKGVDDATFMPNRAITREQMAVMLLRAVDYASPSIYRSLNGAEAKHSFRDTGSIAAWASGDVGKAVKAGFMKGVKEDEFGPLKNATRAEAAVVINRVLQYIGYI